MSSHNSVKLVKTRIGYSMRAIGDGISWILSERRRVRLPFVIERIFARNPEADSVTVMVNRSETATYLNPRLASDEWLTRKHVPKPQTFMLTYDARLRNNS